MTIPEIDQLEEAIQAAVTAAEVVPPRMFLSRWMVVGVAEDPEDPSRHCYFRVPCRGYMAPHESLGLMHVVADLIIEAAADQGDEDDDD